MNAVVFTPSLVLGDAVSNDVLSMVAALERAGCRAYASARWINDGIKGITIDQLPKVLATPDDVLIYHHSIGLEESVRLYERLPCRKVVKYHNVTPPHFFQGINKEVMRGCKLGLEQVGRLMAHCSACWVDSDFNGRDLQSACPGQPYQVLPPFNQIEELIEAEPDLTAVSLYDDWLTNVLVVGRIVPNKNNLLAVDAFAAYRARHDPHSRLIFVGDIAQNRYCDQVIKRIRDQRLSRHVVITGKIAQRQLKTLFLTAQMLLTTSSHEGFCLPLVEAMGLRVPIVATPNAAIPGTAGDVAYYAGDSADEIAAAMQQVRSSPLDREDRLNRGWDRYRETFDNRVIERRFLELFEEARVSAPVAVG
jgi:glycosyltransferase involved in cell wall biosynthesis